MTPTEFNPIELLNQKLVTADPNRFYWDYDDRKVHIRRMDITRSGPWIWPYKSGYRNCVLYHRVLFTYLNILPHPCLACWKVVISIDDIETLYKMYKFMLEWKHNINCKLGAEVRHFTRRNFGAYYYHRTKSAGLFTLKKFRDTEIATSGNLSAVLKRGCTEFEMKFGPSDEWDEIVTPEEIKIQMRLAKVL